MAHLLHATPFSVKTFFKSGILCLLILSGSIVEMHAQNKYRGKVIISNNKNKIGDGIALQISETKEIVYTDALGWFTIYDDRGDSIHIEVVDQRYMPIKFTAYLGINTLVVITRNKLKRWSRFDPVTPFGLAPDPSKTIIYPNENKTFSTSNAALLLQHTVPGLTVTRAGNDPNMPFQLFNRGISSVAHRNAPLVIIDGMPEMSLERLNPEDIASIAVTKNAIGGAKHGIMGGGGVIEVHTLLPSSDLPVLRYHSSFGVASVQKNLPILEASEFRQFKPQHDMGANTDWIGTITQTGISHRHHLSYSKGSEKRAVYASLGFHDNEGVLKQSGYKQGNARLNFRGTSKNGKTTYLLHSAFTQRDAQLSDPYAFSEAIRYNPTIPVYDENGNLTTKLGFEYATPNPLGRIVLSKNMLRTREWAGGFQAKNQVDAGLSLEYQLSIRSRSLIGGQRPPNYNWFGFEKFDRKHISGKIQSNQQQAFGKVKINRYTGFEVSMLKEERSTFSHHPSNIDEINFKTLQNPGSKWDDLDYEKTKYPKSTLSVFTGGDIEWEIFTFYAGARYDRVYLQEDEKSAVFYHAGITSDMKQLMDFAWLDEAKLTLGFGKTGSLLTSNGIYGIQLNNQFAGEFLAYNYLRDQKINENKTEIDLQFNCSLLKNRLHVVVNIYDNLLYDQDFASSFTGEIGNKGLETSCSFKSKKEKKVQWQTGIGFFTNKSVTYRYSNSNQPMTLAQALSTFIFNEIWLEPNSQAGQLYGTRTNGTIVNGRYEPLLNPDNTPLKEVIGQALPLFGLTFTNDWTWKNWDLSIKLRSIVGHNLYNNFRDELEIVNPGDNNILKTKHFNAERIYGQNGNYDIFLENASFLKMDYLSIGFRPAMKKGELRLYLAGHDLLTISGYTGIDPEPVYQEQNVALAGGSEPFDRYYRSRQVVFGVQLSL